MNSGTVAAPGKAQPAKPRSSLLFGYRWSMRILGLAYLFATAVAFLFPTELFYVINVGPKVFKLTEAVPDPSERFWCVLASAGFAMLASLCFLSAESPKTRGYALVHLLAKVIGSAGFIYMYLYHLRFFAYLVGAGIETTLALLVIFLMVRVTGELR